LPDSRPKSRFHQPAAERPSPAEGQAEFSAGPHAQRLRARWPWLPNVFAARSV